MMRFLQVDHTGFCGVLKERGRERAKREQKERAREKEKRNNNSKQRGGV